MSPIANYTTEVAVEKSVQEISGILVTHKAKGLALMYDDDGMIEAIMFKTKTLRGEMTFRLPAHVEAVHRVLLRESDNGGIPRRFSTEAHARRVAWRIIRDWIRAQMAILEAEMVKLEEVFMPYALTPSGQTVFQAMEEGRLNFLPPHEQGPEGDN